MVNSTQQDGVSPWPFPPYGEMTEGLQNELERDPGPPKAFDTPATWATFRAGITADLQRTLWPIWDEASQQWIGRTIQQMTDLTRTDLGLLLMFRNRLVTPPTPPNPELPLPTHGAFYNSEDLSGGFLDMFGKYNKAVTSQTLHLLKSALEDGGKKYGTIPHQFKVLFQRPRAFQMTFILRTTPVKPVRAYTAGSPALPSGHTIQALLGIGAVLEKRSTFPATPLLVESLQQLAVDIGDRRVLAGLHYPSDSIASWIIVMRVASHVFPSGSGVPELLLEAIKRKSLVYQVVSGVPEYADALNLLP